MGGTTSSAAGGGLLIGLTVGTFHAVGIDVEDVVTEMDHAVWFGWGDGDRGAWLVESKQNVIENIAPVLARVFSPLTILLLVALLIAFAADPDLIDVDRELLILMTVILALVLALWLYAVSARLLRKPRPVSVTGIAGGAGGDGDRRRPCRSDRHGRPDRRTGADREPVGRPVSQMSSCWSTSRSRLRLAWLSWVVIVRSRCWNAGRPPTCWCTPHGRPWW